MRVYLASDHAGYELKSALLKRLAEIGYEPADCGPAGYVPGDDYPVYVLRAARQVAAEPGSFGIVIGGSGNGEQISANKVAGVRAALAWSEETARLAREHNDANVLSLGGRMHTIGEALRFAEIFLGTAFSGGARHARRLAMITRYEQTGEMPPLPVGQAHP